MAIKVPNVNSIIKLISDINHIYPEQATIYRVKSKEYCPLGHYDPIRNTSTDPTCSVCGGTGYVIEYETIQIPVSIEFPDETQDIQHLAPGTFVTDRLLITIDKAEIDKYNIDVDTIEFIIYAGEKYKVEAYRKERLEGIYYELLLEVKKIE